MSKIVQPMGIGELGDKEIVFVRKFRWTLQSDLLLPSFIVNVKFDHIKKIIYFGHYEVFDKDGQDPIQKWIDSDHSQEILLFTTYDGCGNKLYERSYKGICLIEDSLEFDYSCSEISTRKIGVSYEYMSFKKDLKTHINADPVEMQKVVINHLNAQTEVEL